MVGLGQLEVGQKFLKMNVDSNDVPGVLEWITVPAEFFIVKPT